MWIGDSLLRNDTKLTSQKIAKGSNVGEVDEEDFLHSRAWCSDDIEGIIMVFGGLVVLEYENQLTTIK